MTPAWCQRPLRPRRLWPYDAWPLPCAPAEHLHVTLAFLAEVSDRRPDDLVGRVARAATGRTAFPAVVAGGARSRLRAASASSTPVRPDRTRAHRAQPVGDKASHRRDACWDRRGRGVHPVAGDPRARTFVLPLP
jgi:hypothetical protein